MRRLSLCLPRSSKCADIRQIERCIEGLHIDLLISVLVAIACPVIFSLAVPYIAYAVSIPYMGISVCFRILTKKAIGSFRTVASLNRGFKALGISNISLSLFSFIICCISSATGSSWVYVVSLCFYTISLTFHILIVTFATKMYSILRDEQIAVGGRCMAESYIPGTRICKECTTNNENQIQATPKGSAMRVGNMMLNQMGLDTPMDSSSICVSATTKERLSTNKSSAKLANTMTQQDKALVTMGTTPIIATSPKKNCFPPVPDIQMSTEKGKKFDEIDPFEGFEKIIEERPIVTPARTEQDKVKEATRYDDINAATLIEVPVEYSQKISRSCKKCTNQCSTPIAKYSQLSPESDLTIL